MLFRVLNAFRGSAPWLPTPGGVGPNHYPLDLNGAERNTRPATGFSSFPYPPIVRNVSGILPLFDMAVWQQAFGKKAFGPGVNAPFGSDALTNLPTMVYPTLPKVTPTTQAGE